MKKLILFTLLTLSLFGFAACQTAAQSLPVDTPVTVEVAAQVAGEGSYTLDSSATTLGWAAARIVGMSHEGTIRVVDGHVDFVDGVFSAGEFTIDMTSITESKNNEMFLNHIKSADFFDVENYPTSTIVITSMSAPNAEGVVQVIGDLTILNQTHSVTFPATVDMTPDSFHAVANFTIDRTLWGVVYDSGSVFKQLGEKAIRDEVTYNLDLTLTR